MRDVQTLRQLPGGNSKLATRNSQLPTCNVQRATRNLQHWAKISASHSHFALSAVTTHVQVATSRHKLPRLPVAVAANANELLPPPWLRHLEASLPGVLPAD